jgi:hypothetical protein
MRRFLIIASALALSGCMEPIVVMGSNGLLLKGSANIELFSSSFSVTDGTLTCGGDSRDGLQSDPDYHGPVTGSVTCSDGRKGVVVYYPQSFSGHVRLTDGTEADIVTGDAAQAIIGTPPANAPASAKDPAPKPVP